MGLFYFVSALVFGVAITRRVSFPLYRFEAVAFSVTLGLFLWAWLGFVASLLMPYDVALPIVVTGTALASIALWPGGAWPAARPLEGGRTAWVVWGVATAAISAIVLRLFWTHNLPRDAEGIWTGGATWGDYGVHATFISHFAAAAHLPMDMPIASGEKITYPVLSDLLSAFFLQGGMSMHAALFWPGVLLALAFCQLLIATGLRLFGRLSVGLGGMVLALTMGSAAGAWTAWSDWRESGKGLFSFLGALPTDYSQVLDDNAHVTNLFADALLPQRAILFGLGLGLIVLIYLHQAREHDTTKPLWPAAVIVGLLPMAHPHTFIVTMAWMAALAAEAAWRQRAIPWAFIRPMILAVVIALPQLIWQQTANGRGTGGRFRFGWMWQHGESLLGYWWANFGLFGLLLIITPIVLRRHRQLLWLLPMLALFLIAQVYAFQPFEYDNMKLIGWAYLAAGFYISYLAVELVRRRRAFLALVLPIGLVVIAPGALAITREFQVHDQFASPDDIALADWASKHTQIDDVFLTSDRPNQPVATLAGRTIVLGYRGWLYNFTIPYTDREAAVRAGMSGNWADPSIDRYNAKYLVVGTYEDDSWGVNRPALDARTPVWSNGSWRVYQLR